jgi:elongation factor 3
MNKKSGYERESAGIAFQALAKVLGPPAGPLFLPYLPSLFELYMDKGEVVRQSTSGAVKAIMKIFPPEAVRLVFRVLEGIVENGKWRTKVVALDSIRGFVSSAPEAVANELVHTLPMVERAMHDTKSEARVAHPEQALRFRADFLKQVSAAAVKCSTVLCTTLANADLAPHIPNLVKCMAEPGAVPACIKSMSSTTFVAEVTAPALAVLVPLLQRALNDRSMEVQRRTVVIIDNLVKLVRDPTIAAAYLSQLVEGVDKIAKGAAFPEVRAFGEDALATLTKAGASASGEVPPQRDVGAETAAAQKDLVPLLPTELVARGQPAHPLFAQIVEFEAGLVADLLHTRRFQDKKAWARCVGVYTDPWLNKNAGQDGATFAEAVREHFHSIERAKHAPQHRNDDGEGELLCDTIFSLAYGALLLLSHTSLKLYRGRRYGILGTNGSGKSTLMRQLRDGKVENFPPPSELRCVMVEHALQGENTSLSIIDFVASGMCFTPSAETYCDFLSSDPALAAVPRKKIASQLKEVGFDEERQQEMTGGLSGGWKMKLELARAMLYNADLLLLDEVRRHVLELNNVLTCFIAAYEPRTSCDSAQTV